MGMDFNHSSRKWFLTGLALLLIPAILIPGCSKKRETTTSQTITEHADTTAMDTGKLDTGRAPVPPVRANPIEIKIADAGQTFTYHVGDKFTVLLDGNNFPQAQLSFDPGGVISLDSSAPPATAPNYAAAFVAVAPGEAVVKNGTFTVTIRIVS